MLRPRRNRSPHERISLNEVVLNVSRVSDRRSAELFWPSRAPRPAASSTRLVRSPHRLVRAAQGERHSRRSRATHGPPTRGPSLRVGQPTIRTSLFFAAASGMLFNLNVPLPLLATGCFISARCFGLMMSVFGVGGIVGGLVAATVARNRRGDQWVRSRRSPGCRTRHGVRSNLSFEYGGLLVTAAVDLVHRSSERPRALRSRRLNAGARHGFVDDGATGCEPITSPFVGFVARRWARVKDSQYPESR